MSTKRNESVVVQQLKQESAIRRDIVSDARNRSTPSGYLTPMTEEVQGGPRLETSLETLNRGAAIRLDMVRSAKERKTPQWFQREAIRQARNALETTLKDEHSHPEMRKAAAFHLAELQAEAGRFFAAKRALRLADGYNVSPARGTAIQAQVDEGIKRAHLLREFRQLRDDTLSRTRVGVNRALANANKVDEFLQRADGASMSGILAIDLAQEEHGRWLVEAARKASQKGERKQAKLLASQSLVSFTRALESADAHVVARAQFDAARAHLLLAKLSGSRKQVAIARQHSSAITKRLPVSSVTRDTVIDRRELRTLRQQLTVTEKQLEHSGWNRLKEPWDYLTTNLRRLVIARPQLKLRTLAASSFAVTGAVAMLMAPTVQGMIPVAAPKPVGVHLSNSPSQADIRAQEIAQEQAKLNALYVERAAEQQRLDAATADYLTKKQIDDSLTGPEGAARAVRKAGMANRVLAVATSGAESSYGASKYSGWTDAQGIEHVRVEPNQTVGIGLFQQSVPDSQFNAQTPYVVGLENNIDFNAIEAEKNYIGPHGGRFTSFCADYTPGHCMDGRYYLAPGSPVLRFIPTAQQAVANEQAKYNAEVAAAAQVNGDQAQLNDLTAQINAERVVLRQVALDNSLAG